MVTTCFQGLHPKVMNQRKRAGVLAKDRPIISDCIYGAHIDSFFFMDVSATRSLLRPLPQTFQVLSASRFLLTGKKRAAEQIRETEFGKHESQSMLPLSHNPIYTLFGSAGNQQMGNGIPHQSNRTVRITKT